jgi:ATP-dependent Lhr-like helicase
MLRITRQEAGRGGGGVGRLEEMLARSAGRSDVVRAPRVTPLAAPLRLGGGRVRIRGRAEVRQVAEAAEAGRAEAGLDP